MALSNAPKPDPEARAETAVLEEALKAYRQGGRADFSAFDRALRQYHGIVAELMTPRKNPFSPCTDKLFTFAD